MLKKILNNYFDYAVIVFLFLCTLPFIILSLFVQPSWDDFGYSYYSTEYGFLKAQDIWYTTFSGRYFSTAVLSSINPLVFGSIMGYKILTLFFIVVFIILIYFFISELASGAIDLKEKIIGTLAFSYLYFYGIPSVSLGFFWLSSTVIYQLGSIMMLLLFTMLLKFFRAENKNGNYLLAVVIAVLIFSIEGTNEVSMMALTLFFVSVLILNLILTKKINRWFLFFVIVSIISFCLVYFAPGNNVRSMDYPESHQVLFSIKSTLADLFRFFIYRIYNLPLLLFTILFIPFSSRIISDKRFSNRFILINPVYTIILFLALLASGFFVSYWSLGTTLPARTLNVVYFLFLIGWFFNIIVIVNYFYVKHNLKINPLPKYAYVIICFAIFFSFMKESNSVKLAYKDVFYGTASKFNSELNNRYENIYKDNSDTILVDTIKYVPDSFFFCDVTPDTKSLFNRYQATFFKKKFIKKRESTLPNQK
ncbi:MAG: DUF6056 family protein [Ignavibacteria bacterium]